MYAHPQIAAFQAQNGVAARSRNQLGPATGATYCPWVPLPADVAARVAIEAMTDDDPESVWLHGMGYGLPTAWEIATSLS